MFCVNCGAKLEDGTKFCPNCGAALSQAVPVQSAPTSSAPMQSEPVQAAPVQDAPAQSAPALRKGKVSVSLICGIISIVAFLVFALITPRLHWHKLYIPSLIVSVDGIAAAVFGLVQAAASKRSTGKKKVAGTIVSVVGLVLCLAACSILLSNALG